MVNRVTEEMEHDFRRANHQIEFHLTFPFSKERQQMFQDYFPEELFVPIADKNRPETDRKGLDIKTISHMRYLKLFEKTKNSLH